VNANIAPFTRCFFLLTCAQTMPASAASTKSVGVPGCDLILEGEVSVGSLQRLETDYKIAFEKFRRIPKKPTESVTFMPTLCLNSPGGNFQEALRIIDWIRDTGFVTTVIPQDAKCFSACALIFLFGNWNEGHGLIGVRRRLHHLGHLGFHTPHISPILDAKDALLSARAYRDGIKAIGQILEKDWDEIFFPRSLLIESLKKEPNDFIVVDTIERAASWGIEIFGFRPPKVLTERLLEAACINKTRPDQFKGAKGMTRWWGSGESPTGQREELTASARTVTFKNGHHRAVFKNFGDENNFVCVVDVYRQQDGTLAIDINFGDSVRSKDIPKPMSLAVAKEYGGNTPLWHTFVGSTRLQDLPKEN
jgi:hypothetical protein